MPPRVTELPVKKQSKWSAEEDALIIELRGSGMKWEDVSKRLPGRSAISCRLHYQNYLERRSEWDEERKNKLARLYERRVKGANGPPNALTISGSSQRCGLKSQKSLQCRGAPPKPCTGSWARPTWPGELE